MKTKLNNLFFLFMLIVVSITSSSAYDYDDFYTKSTKDKVFELEPKYIFQGDYITSFDIFPEVGKNIFIHKPNKEDNVFYLDADEIVKKFKEHDVTVEQDRIRRVKFIRLNPMICITDIAEIIEELFLQKYPNLHIEDLEIFPKNYIDELPKDYQINIKQSTMKRNEGYFYLETKDRKRFYFTYKVDGGFTVFKASKNFDRDDVIEFDDVYPDEIKFRYAKDDYIKEKQLGLIQAKRIIPRDTPLTYKLIRTKPVIERGDIVKAFLKNGLILIKVDVKAITSGATGDIITVRTLDNNTNLKAKILSKELVEIE